MKSFLEFIKKNYLWIFLIFLAIFFLTFPMIITYDSSHYMKYVSIFERQLPFATWDIVRGPVFPVFIFLSNFFFGKTAFGLVFSSFIFYLLMLFVASRVLKVFVSENKVLRNISYVIFTILVMFNIIIFGYFHTLLTEFMAISISVVSCYMSWLLLVTPFKEEGKGYLFLSLYFILMVPFAWFLKQPYVTISLLPLLIAVLIKLFNTKFRKDCLPILVVLFISLISLAFSIWSWNSILKYKGIDPNGERAVTTSFGGMLIDPLESYEIIEETSEQKVEEMEFLSDEEIGIMEGREEFVRIVEVYNQKGELIDRMVIETDSQGRPSTSNALKFLVKAFLTHPKEMFDSYLTNYLGIINIYKVSTKDSAQFEIEKKFHLSGCYENCGIATTVGLQRSNIYYVPEYMFGPVADYEQSLNTPPLFRFVLNKLKGVSIVTFSLSYLLLPFVLIAAILYTIFSNKKLSKQL